jgi:hypothetical protein
MQIKFTILKQNGACSGHGLDCTWEWYIVKLGEGGEGTWTEYGRQDLLVK